MPRRIALLFALICTNVAPERVAGAPPEKASEQVVLTVVPATTSLYVGDPLIIKGILRNKGKEAVVLPRAFDASWGGVRCEICPPDVTTFERTFLSWEGLKCGQPAKVKVGAGESVVRYERLSGRGPLAPTFHTAGKWRLRLAITTGDEVITSEPVTLEITTPSKQLKKALDDYAHLIERRVASWASNEEDLKVVPEAQDRLAGTNAAQLIAQARVLRDLEFAGAAKAHRFAMEAVTKHRATLSAVAREEFDLIAAKLLCERREYRDAKRLVDPISESSRERDWLRAEIDYYLSLESK